MAEQVNKSPAFQFYPKDFLTDDKVLEMSNEVLGMYVKLLCIDWLNDGFYSSAILKLSGYDWLDHSGGTRDDWRDIEAQLSSCFVPHPTKQDYLTNPRVQREKAAQLERRKERVASGQKGAAKKWGQPSVSHHLKNGSAINQPMANDGSSSTTPSTSSSPKDIYNKPQKVAKLKSKFSLENWKPPEGKTKYADYVYLTEAEYAKAEKFYQNLGLGSDGVKRALQHLDAWFVSNPKKRAERTDDYRALIGWPAQRVMEEMAALNRLTRSEQTLKGDFRR